MTEFCWLIDNGTMALGFCDNKPKWMPYTDKSVIHFSRKQDAKRMIKFFNVGGDAVEHGYD